MTPLERAELSLEGLSIGDAFGQRYFGQSDVMLAMIKRRALPIPPWQFTDDTVMAIGIVETLRARGALDPDHLAERFAVNFQRNPHRGYGAMARYVLSELWDGKDWRIVAPAVFGGSGSYGNGGAAAQLGNGSMVSAQDTVPLALWCAARHLDDFEAAMWETVSALGDRDTTCAMVGGIVALRVGHAGIPAAWKAARESLVDWR
jgi:ADP-ribosylglycohydrolase